MRTSAFGLLSLCLLAPAARADDGPGPDCTPIEAGETCAEGRIRDFVVVPGGCAKPDDRDWEKVGIANYYLWTDRACTAAPAAQPNCEGFSPRPSWCDASSKPAPAAAPPAGAAGSLPTGAAPNIGGCPKPSGQIAFGGMNYKHTYTYLDVAPGVIDSFQLPKTDPQNGAPLQGGIFAGTGLPWSPSMTLEWSVSRCPGDFDYYKSAAGGVENVRPGRPAGIGRDGKPTKAQAGSSSTTHPCGGVFGLESNGVKWSLAGGPDTCKTDGGNWYANVRVLQGCSGKCQFVVANAFNAGKP
jgi:hypothetical protein